MSKKMLSIEDIEGQTVVELPAREMMALAIAGPGLVNIAAAVDRVEVNIPVDVDLQQNQICVNVAALGAAAGCA